MTAPIGKVFISHAGADKAFVDQLVSDLAARAIPVWYDKLDLRVGDSVTGGINEGLTASKYFLIVLSKHSVASRWVTEELNAALMEQVARGGTFLLPALLEDCEVPPLLRHRRYADFRADYDHGLADLLSVLGRDREAAAAVNGLALYPWPDVAASDDEFVYLHSTRFDKFFRMSCDLSRTVDWAIDHIVDTLRLPWTQDVPQLGMKWSFGYRLILGDKGMDLSARLRDAGVSIGTVLTLGINGTYEDVWENELKAMWDGSKIYEMTSAMRRDADLRQRIRTRGDLTSDRLRELANACFAHV
ncbi:MAG: toll/interleukin-1 receptor domain-containing protein [Candidatus Bipolaricaulis sp.]|nr:toll/interleukin-1 receptor domain-containing protein [Candidatus Bipolaricaulis sp.]